MLLAPQSRENLRSLKALIKGCSMEAQWLRKHKINKLTEHKKQLAQLEKTRLGIHTRHYQLAYGFLRGLAYKEIEHKRNPQGSVGPTAGETFTNQYQISTSFLTRIINSHTGPVVREFTTVPQIHCRWRPITEKDVKDWINTDKRVFLTREQNKAMLEHEAKRIGPWSIPQS